MAEFDLVVIGSGPGGYQSAIRAAQLKAKVAVIEKADIGGVCLNSGCIPTKTLIASAEFMSGLKKAKEFGIEISGAKLDFSAVSARKGKIVKKLQLGIGGILKSYNIEIIKREAGFISGNDIKIYGNPDTPMVRFKKCIIATGSKTALIPGINIDGNIVVSSTELLNLTEVPESLLVIGGGVIGTEFGSLFNRLGSKVTIVEALPKILANQDEDVSNAMTLSLKKKGAEILTSAKLLGVKGNTAEVETPEGKKQISAAKILICVGRKASYEGLGLENAGVVLENGKNKGIAVKTGKFPFSASGRAGILAETEGFTKVIVDAKTDGILGVHILGPEATELIHTAAMAVKMECTTAEFKRIAFNHPTLSETLLEAAHDVHKEAIDYPKRP